MQVSHYVDSSVWAQKLSFSRIFEDDTGNDSSGIGNWCLMASGNWNGGINHDGSSPAHLSAWCLQTLGFNAPEIISSDTKNVNISAIENAQSKSLYKLWTNGLSTNEYFLVENRQPIGYDAALPGNGLLIWHIDESQPNNDNQNHYKVALEQADGKFDLEKNIYNRGDNSDPFPGDSNKRVFNSTSIPNSNSYLNLGS